MEDAEWQRHSLDDGPSVESEEAELEPRWIEREFEAEARKFGVAIYFRVCQDFEPKIHSLLS